MFENTTPFRQATPWLLGLFMLIGMDYWLLPRVNCSIEPTGLACFALYMGGLLALTLLVLAAGELPNSLSRPSSRTFCKAMVFAKRFGYFQLAVIYVASAFKAIVVLSYVNIRAGAPAIDADLAHWDRLIHFDWLGYYRLLNSLPMLRAVLRATYASAPGQMSLLMFFLAITGHTQRMREMLALLLISSFISVVTVRFMPAQGTYYFYEVANQSARELTSQFLPLRTRPTYIIDFTNLQGLVSIPSFHTCMAIIFCYALRGWKWLFPVSLALNGAMLLSTPYYGGHYLVDMLAGAVLCAVLIWLSRLWFSTAPELRALRFAV
ncbi:phosphatase PAP2 family protein [Paludibacterium purpuratum]|uniref:PAP2 superfamily protein n=1 Tax=Paludibacterium purpuratum TaxID=1144873 RepID=A0A4R7B711_9NEIS|nr:phosphatase PAP2 family protein [Paludibacterium purpuratum]TDR80253.1 PAP2 superfamily protein [Paludibacterium purpuratum]